MPEHLQMILVSKRTYLVLLGVLFAVAFIAGVTHVPFSQSFDRFGFPLLSLILALPWLLDHGKTPWLRWVIFPCSAFAFFIILFSIRVSDGQRLSDSTACFVAALILQLLLLRMRIADHSVRSAFLAQHLAVGFVVLLDVYLRVQGTELLAQLPLADARFLFLAPLASMALWAQGEIEVWRKWTLIILVCSVFQAGIGMFDLFGYWNLRWALYGACLLWLGALGIGVQRARALKRTSRY